MQSNPAVLLNDLPQYISNATNLDEFKYLYRQHFVTVP